MTEVVVIILLIVYIGWSIYNAYLMGEYMDSIVFGILTFGASLVFTPIIMYALVKDIWKSNGTKLF